jgi:nucleoside-diphosphate-sugar epimerase
MPYRTHYHGKRCLITGGLGFIGSNLARALVALGAEVHLVDALIEGHGGNPFNVSGIAGEVAVTIADIGDATAMRPLVEQTDFIFNLAGQISHIDSMRDPLKDLDINARAPLALLEVCREVNPDVTIVYTSTRQLYGKPLFLPVDERHPLRPVDVNGVTNVAGEMLHLLYHDVYGMKTVSLRLTNTYGPRMLLHHNRQGFIAWFVRQALEKGEITLYGDGGQKRDLNEVGDVVDALLRAGATEGCIGHAFNLGHRQVVTLRQIAETLATLAPGLSVSSIPWPEEKKRIDIGDYYADFSAFQRAADWTPKVELEEGLARMLRYYEGHADAYLPEPRRGLRIAP